MMTGYWIYLNESKNLNEAQLDINMYFLHTDAQKAADSICDQDAKKFFDECVRALCLVSEGKDAIGMIDDWLRVDSMNYHWLAYFCDCLNPRVENGKYYHKVKMLRVCSPTSPRCQELTPFPYANSVRTAYSNEYQRMAASLRIASYRADYVRSRFKYAEWKTLGCPGWFFRLANTLLNERERQDFFLRVQFAGPSGSDDTRSLGSQREDVRDGPVAEIDGGPSGTFRLW